MVSWVCTHALPSCLLLCEPGTHFVALTGLGLLGQVGLELTHLALGCD